MDFIPYIIDDISLHKENKGNEGVTNIHQSGHLLMNYKKT